MPRALIRKRATSVSRIRLVLTAEISNWYR